MNTISAEGISLDKVIGKALEYCNELTNNKSFDIHINQLSDLMKRLSKGELRIAVLGQFNRGKSTFLNALLELPVLPSSVLPITSIPTIISYGKENSCTIEFYNKKPNVQTNGTIDEISDILLKYVAEKNNPENTLAVSKAYVKCNSQILQHGTVLIDTPGFGSTHTHNTKTTMDLISSCDATLFLLSADLPITQVEVDFLKEAVKHVPYIFFIYNKIDLINKAELKTTTDFIRTTLLQKLNLSTDLKIFPISAKLANEFNKKKSSNHKMSGIDSVKTEVIDFMLREKYFALSDAINKKGSLAITEIINLLNKDKNNLLDKINSKKDDLSSLKNSKKNVINTLENLLDIILNDNKNISDKIKIFVNNRKNHLHKNAISFVETFGNNTINRSKLNTIQESITSLFVQLNLTLYAQLTLDINDYLNTLSENYVKKIENNIDSKQSVFDNLYNKIKNSLKIKTDDTWTSDYKFIINKDILKTPIFTSKKKRQTQILEKINSQMIIFLNNSFDQTSLILEDTAKEKIIELHEFIKNYLSSINEDINLKIKQSTKNLEETKKELNPELKTINNLLDNFIEIKKYLS